MAETVAIDRPPAARAAVSRRQSAKSATVSASALAQHLDCSRAYVGKLEAEGVIQRQGNGLGEPDKGQTRGIIVDRWTEQPPKDALCRGLVGHQRKPGPSSPVGRRYRITMFPD
jgi:hypothetical protein